MKKLFIPFAKIDEEKREVAGRLTQEIVDRDGEIWDFASSVPHIEAWSAEFQKATDGKSFGNLRAMHQPISAGKLTAITINPVDKAVDIVAKVVDDAEWEKTREGVYTGFSIGGEVMNQWRTPDDPTHKRFEVKPNEASLADYPCVPTATFEYVKVGGMSETRHFKKIAERDDTTPKEGESKYGDVEYADPKNKKYPIDTKAHVRAALSYWGRKKNRNKYGEDDQKTITKRILAAAKKFGIDVADDWDAKKLVRAGTYRKSLYEVGSLANLIQSLAWLQESAESERLYEGDDSSVPDELLEHTTGLIDTLETMLGEESDELLAVLTRDRAVGGAYLSTAKTAGSSGSGHTETPMPATNDVGPFRKIAKKHVEKLADIHEDAKAVHKLLGHGIEKMSNGDDKDYVKAVHKMMGQHCEKIAGFIDEVGGLPTTSTEGDERTAVDGSEKIAKAEYEKVTGQRDDFEKRLKAADEAKAAAEAKLTQVEKERDELADGVEQLTKAVEVRKGKLVAVDKTEDGQAAGAAGSKKEEPVSVKKVAEMSSSEFRSTLHGSFKKAFENPHIQTGMPEPKDKGKAAAA